MAVSLVGTGTFIKSTGNGNATTLTFSTGAAAANDIVVAWWVHTRGALVANLRSSAGTAYTEIGSLTNGNLGVEAGYRILTGAETTVSSCATGSAQDAVVLAAIVIRGVDQTPIVVDNSTTGTSSNPNSPAVTVGGPNDAVITSYALLSNIPATAAPTGYTNMVSTSILDTRTCAGGLAYKSTNAGVTDPSSWTGAGVAGTAWIGWTITIRSTEALAFTWQQIGYFPDQVNAPVGMIGY